MSEKLIVPDGVPDLTDAELAELHQKAGRLWPAVPWGEVVRLTRELILRRADAGTGAYIRLAEVQSPGTVAREWASFSERVMNAKAPPIQVVEMRRAFYAGAQAFFGLMNQVSDDHEPTDEDVEYLERLNKELLAFGRAVAEGKA